MSDLRTRIAAVLKAHRDCGFVTWSDADTAVFECSCGVSSSDKQFHDKHLAYTLIRELPELRRIDQIREVCVASLNLDRVPGEALSDRAWLADTVLNVLNGEVDD